MSLCSIQSDAESHKLLKLTLHKNIEPEITFIDLFVERIINPGNVDSSTEKSEGRFTKLAIDGGMVLKDIMAVDRAAFKKISSLVHQREVMLVPRWNQTIRWQQMLYFYHSI